MDWYVGLSGSDYSLEGRESTDLTVTVLHQESPLPGTYQIILIGQDLDNSISEQYYVELSVGEIPDIEVVTDYDIVPVHPIEPTSVPIYLFNTGNTEIAYDLQVQSPNGWDANFIQDFTPSQVDVNSENGRVFFERFFYAARTKIADHALDADHGDLCVAQSVHEGIEPFRIRIDAIGHWHVVLGV